MKDTKKLLKLRKEKKNKNPTFTRVNSTTKPRITDSWRRPRGRQNKTRRCFRGYRAVVCIGYGKPKAVKGMHKTGLLPTEVRNISDLSRLNKETQGAVIGSTVGQRKKLEIIKKAKELNITILNLDETKYMEKAKQTQDAKKAKKTAKTKKATKKTEEKKDAKKTEKTKETKEEDKKKEEKKEKDKILTKRPA